MPERPNERAVAAAMDAFDASRKQYRNMFDVGAVLQAAYDVDFPTRDEGDADDAAVRGGGRPQQLPDVAPPAVGPHNLTAGASCDDCGRRYGNEYGFPDLTVSNEAWKQISPTGDDGGLLCPSCMVARAAALGLENVRATFVSGPFAMPHDPDSTSILEHAADTLRGFNRDDPQRVAGTLLRLRDELTDRFNHLEQAARERFIAGLTDAQIDAIDNFATEGANTAPDGTQLDGFDMDRWREGFREGLRRAAVEETKKALVKQEGDSDCFSACLASLTGIPLVEFPRWTMEDRDAAGQWNAMLRFLESRGWTMWLVWKRLNGVTIAHGKSPRGNWDHSVLYKDGEPYFDPHPSNDFLLGEPESFTVVAELVRRVAEEADKA